MQDYKIESIKKVSSIDKDDILVLQLNEKINSDKWDLLKKDIMRVTNHKKVLVLDPNIKLEGIVKAN